MIEENNQEKILIFSYYANIAGACQAEWIDDKVEALVESGKKVALVSSISGNSSKLSISHYRIPSLSLFDFIDELKRASLAKDLFQLSVLFLLPFALTLGILFDILLLIVTKGIGEGRWSWFMCASVVGIWLRFKFKPDKILTSGGPASAHLAGVIVAKLFSIPVVVELQDPLSGEGIGRNVQARGWLYKVEKYILTHANMTAYVTDAAADFAKKEFGISNVISVYPGAKKFNFSYSNNDSEVLKIVHLGSLYSTRNFDSIMMAIDALIDQGKLKVDQIELINLGHVSEIEKNKLDLKAYVTILKPVPRMEALLFASKCDVCLLIQHQDNRSNVTIPYKTYDYLNINNHILGLLNSNELTQLIESHGHTAIPLGQITQITQYILDIKSKRILLGNKNSIDYIAQANSLIDCV
jgi:hypothetical protein